MKGIVVGIVVAGVLTPAAFADQAPAPGKAGATPSAYCAKLRSEAAAWTAFQAVTPLAQGKTFAQHFGTGKELRNAPGRCVSWRVKMLAEAKRTQTAPEQPAASLAVAEACKAILAGKQAAPQGKSYRNVGDCLKDNADDD